MLSLAIPETPDALTDALANIVGVLHPDAGFGGDCAAIETAHGATDLFLRRLRHHLHENGLLVSALLEAKPSCAGRLGSVGSEHRLLKQISHDLCDRIRYRDLRGARDIARRSLAILMDHLAHESRVLREIVRGLDEPSTIRFARLLFERTIQDAARSERALAGTQAITDLHSLYLRLIQHLQESPIPHPPIEADHEHTCRR